MMTEQVGFTLSQLSLTPTEDWDRSISEDSTTPVRTGTPQNSVAFPANGQPEGEGEGTPGRSTGKRTLSELLKLHAQEGTNVDFSAEEASRVAEVLGQWINSGPSPYEDEDDFFTRTHAQDDSSLLVKRATPDTAGRPRGQSESVLNAGAR